MSRRWLAAGVVLVPFDSSALAAAAGSLYMANHAR
jgi:hypothetical protein